MIFIGVRGFTDIGRYQSYSIDLYSAFYTIILTKDLDLSGAYVPFLRSFLRCNYSHSALNPPPVKANNYHFYYIRLNEFVQCKIRDFSYKENEITISFKLTNKG